MTSALVVRPSASRDITEALSYHSQYGRDDAFMSALDHVFARIAERPLMFPVVYGDGSSRLAAPLRLLGLLRRRR